MKAVDTEVVTIRKVGIPSFLFWPPSIAHTLSHWIMRYIVQDGFCPWFRGGCTACSKGRDEFQCKVDPPPSGAPWATFLTAKWSTTLA